MKLQNTDAFILLSFAHDIRNVIGDDIPSGLALVNIASRYVERLTNAGHSTEDAFDLLNNVLRQVRSEKEAV
jgi:hypothetical protein